MAFAVGLAFIFANHPQASGLLYLSATLFFVALLFVITDFGLGKFINPSAPEPEGAAPPSPRAPSGDANQELSLAVEEAMKRALDSTYFNAEINSISRSGVKFQAGIQRDGTAAFITGFVGTSVVIEAAKLNVKPVAIREEMFAGFELDEKQRKAAVRITEAFDKAAKANAHLVVPSVQKLKGILGNKFATEIVEISANCFPGTTSFESEMSMLASKLP